MSFVTRKERKKKKTSSLEGGKDIDALAALPLAREAVDGALDGFETVCKGDEVYVQEQHHLV